MPEPQLKNTEKIHIVKLKVSNEKGKAKVKVNLREQAMQISWLVKSFPRKEWLFNARVQSLQINMNGT